MKWRRYPKYKDSGIGWLGEVPEHWHVDRLKWTVRSCRNGIWGDEPNGDDDLLCIRVADFDRQRFSVSFDRMTLRSVTPAERRNRLLSKGDLLLEKSGGGDLQPVGAVVSYDHSEPAVCSNFVAKMDIADDCDSRYQTYLHAHLYAGRVNTRSIKQTTGIQNLDADAYLSEPVCYPGNEEQHAIASFLDRETARIDALIEKKQSQIELLQEKRAALISHAVTKGLDPNVKMKDSGIEWLGEVPEHWDMMRIKFVLRAIIDTEHKTAPFYPDGEYFVIRTSNVRDGRIVMKDANYTNQDGYTEWTRRAIPTEGDIVFTREAPAGEACVLPRGLKVCLGQRTVLLRVRRDALVPEFAVYSIYCGIADAFIKTLSFGSTVNHFNMADIGSIPLLIPPLQEQIEIVKIVHRETNRVDSLIEKVMDSINKLSEYRTALISAAVTGKIDVCEEAA
ncbi:MAG: restriction endonuclease subunit S [Bacteroidetes bacterium]|nr:restriction endonuclease subunit S [Bacteroidota bacterium]